jgi:hypothetical protein
MFAHFSRLYEDGCDALVKFLRQKAFLELVFLDDHGDFFQVLDRIIKRTRFMTFA